MFTSVCAVRDYLFPSSFNYELFSVIIETFGCAILGLVMCFVRRRLLVACLQVVVVFAFVSWSAWLITCLLLVDDVVYLFVHSCVR